MKAKRFILMLLVMLGSVTGAWAESVTFNYEFSRTTFEDQLLSYIWSNFVNQSNSYVKVTLDDWNYVISSEVPNKVDPSKKTFTGNATAKSFTITNLQPSKVSIQSYTINGNSHPFPVGQTEYTYELSSFERKNIYSITVTYNILHTHNPAAEWSHDANQHWHACTETGSTCSANGKLDLADHTYGQDGAAYYTSSVCNYVNETRRSEFANRDYLSMTAVGGDMTIGMAKTGSPSDYTMQYSFDKIDWSTVALSATNSNIVEIGAGETCYFRHDLAGATTHVSSGDNSYWTFTMDGTGTIEAGGNIMSLLDATCQQTELPGSPQHVFTKLFLDCEKLTVAPRMDAITSVPQWGFVSMFSGSGITEAPVLSATQVRDGAYRAMFENCKELVSVPMLTATKLNRCAYWDMFKGCDKLSSIEIVNIETMQVEEGSTGRENSFHDMLAGTAVGTNGVIIAPVAMMGDARISLPSNWQWATKLRANEDPDNAGNFYTTFYDSRNDYTIAGGHKAYSGSIEEIDGENELRLTATPGNIIPKGNGVILHGGSGEVLLTVSDEGASTIEGNVLTGSDENTTALANCYILSYGQNGLGFYRYAEGKTLSAHKAYLTYQHGAAEARALRMVFVEDEVDGIQQIENGESEIENSAIYNLNGMRMNKLQKGINIVNGKKVIVK